MRLFYRLLPIIFVGYTIGSPAQQTLVRSAPTDTINLSCNGCRTQITDVALIRGHQSIPINLDKPVKENLLHWRYYDDISKEEVVTEIEPVWTTGRQLWELAPDTLLMSLHINLSVTDSAGAATRVFLVLGGMHKSDLVQLPLSGLYDANTYEPLRFAAIFQPPPQYQKKEAYDCLEGQIQIEKINLRKNYFSGSFEFLGNKIGINQKILFQNGRF